MLDAFGALMSGPRAHYRAHKHTVFLFANLLFGQADLPAQGSEFTLLVARRNAQGEVVLLGEVSQDAALIEKAARHLFE